MSEAKADKPRDKMTFAQSGSSSCVQRGENSRAANPCCCSIYAHLLAAARLLNASSSALSARLFVVAPAVARRQIVALLVRSALELIADSKFSANGLMTCTGGTTEETESMSSHLRLRGEGSPSRGLLPESCQDRGSSCAVSVAICPDEIVVLADQVAHSSCS